MANSEHLEKLCQGPKVWNAWRDENPEIVPDLADAKLTLSQRQFGPRNGGPIDLSGVDMEGAVLRYATLTQADLSGALLNGVDLTHARLDGANLVAADLTDALLDNADFTGAHLERAVLVGASLVNARNLSQEQVQLAHGDSSTLLPASLMPPQSWFPSMEGEEFTDYTEYPVPELIADDNPYEILGVETSAKQEDIRRAYRALVKKLHPDLNPDDKEAQDLFKKVSSAYNILSNIEKRARYDKGEIDAEGRVKPEFEARQQFRRYAFRFYAAATMSLMLVAGLLGVIWHAVLTDSPTTGTVKIALSPPPKNSDRLGTTPVELVSRQAPPRPATVQQDRLTNQAKELGADIAVSLAQVDTSPASDEDAAAITQPSSDNESRSAEDHSAVPAEKVAEVEASALPVVTGASDEALTQSLAYEPQPNNVASPPMSKAPQDQEAQANSRPQAKHLPQSKPDLHADDASPIGKVQMLAANGADGVESSAAPRSDSGVETAASGTASNSVSDGQADIEPDAPQMAVLTAGDAPVVATDDQQIMQSSSATDAQTEVELTLDNPIADFGVPPDLQASEEPPAGSTPLPDRSAFFLFDKENRPVDAVSAFLTARALERLLVVRDNDEESAGAEAPGKAKVEDGVIQDFYFHSIEGKGKALGAGEFSGAPFENETGSEAPVVKQSVPRLPVAKSVVIANQQQLDQSKASAEKNGQVPASKREEVISDILAGGL